MKGGFSVGFCYKKRKFSEYQLYSNRKSGTFQLDAVVFFRAKVNLDGNTCYSCSHIHQYTTLDERSGVN